MDENLYSLTLRYDQSIVRKSVLFFWWKITGWSFFIAMLALLTIFAFFVVSGDSSWITGVIGGVLFFASLIVIVLFFSHYTNAMKKLKSMGKSEATFILKENDFTLSSEMGTSTLPWSAITDIWKTNNFWLLFFGKCNFFTLPIENVPVDVQNFIYQKIKKH